MKTTTTKTTATTTTATPTKDNTVLQKLLNSVVRATTFGTNRAEYLTTENWLFSSNGNRKLSDSNSTCRESMANFMSSNVKKNGIDEGTTYLAFASITSMAMCVRYLNKMEQTFGFKGDPTKEVVKKKIKLSGNRGNITVHVLSLSKEWLASPTLYQTALLIVRTMARSRGERKGMYRGLNKFSKSKPFNIFNTEFCGGDYGGLLYTNHINNMKKYGRELLLNRAILFGGTVNEEWSADRTKTQYGMGERFPLSSASGPTSFCNTLDHMKSKNLSNVYYFKYATKKDIMREIFLGGK